MQTVLRLALKLLTMAGLFIIVGELVSGPDFTPFMGTRVFAAIASLILVFASAQRVRLMAASYLVLVVAISHATNRYFWSAVWNHGYPWPFSNVPQGAGAFIGSVSVFVYQVSLVSFTLLAVIAVGMVAWHLTRRSSGPAMAQPLRSA